MRQAVGGVDVVVDDQDAHDRRRGRRARRGGSGFAALNGQRQRQADDELAALPWPSLRASTAAVHLDRGA